jgi:hypothetical protein
MIGTNVIKMVLTESYQESRQSMMFILGESGVADQRESLSMLKRAMVGKMAYKI